MVFLLGNFFFFGNWMKIVIGLFVCFFLISKKFILGYCFKF